MKRVPKVLQLTVIVKRRRDFALESQVPEEGNLVFGDIAGFSVMKEKFLEAGFLGRLGNILLHKLDLSGDAWRLSLERDGKLFNLTISG